MLPQNILTWMVVTILCAVICILYRRRMLVITPFFFCLVIGAILLTAPLLWKTQPFYLWGALPRIIGLWGGVFFYFCLLQLRLTIMVFRVILWCVTLSALAESLIVFQSLFFQETLSVVGRLFRAAYGRQALGTFQQVNVTASWLATGLSVLMAIVFGHRKKQLYGRHIAISVLASGMLAILSCSLVLTASRVGWLAGGLCYLISAVCAIRSVKAHTLSYSNGLILLLAPVVGVIAGMVFIDRPLTQAIAHTSSNTQRLLTLRVTWQMIMLHPLSGWGLGSFRNTFQNYMALNFSPNPSAELMGHPHNELLYVWFEGGLVALAGFLLIAYAILRLLCCRPDMHRLMSWSMLIPVLLHTQTEFPLYYSAAHFITLLFFLAMLDTGNGRHRIKFYVATLFIQMLPVMRCIVGLLGAGIIVWLLRVMNTGFILSYFETDALTTPNDITHISPPVMTRARFSRDLNLLQLTRFYVSRDTTYLMKFIAVNAEQMKEHPAPDDYDNHIRVLIFLGEPVQAEAFRLSAHRLFPWDHRFTPNGENNSS